MTHLKIGIIGCLTLALFSLDSCKKHHDDIVIGFVTPSVVIAEGDKNITLGLNFAGTLPSGGSLTISVTTVGNVVFGEGKDLTTSPEVVNNTITLTGDLSVNQVVINSFLDAHADPGQSAIFTIVSVPNGFKIGTANTTVVSITDSSLSNGIVAEYLFGGSADDTSGKNNHGTVHGAILAADRLAKPNAAYQFSGSQYIQVPNNTDINFGLNQEFSISLWVSATSTQSDLNGTINNVLRKWMGDAQGYPFTIAYYNETHPSAARKYTSARYDGSSCYHIPEARSGVVTDSFYQLIFIKSGSSLNLYVNGQLIATSADTTVCDTTNNSDLFIGCEGGDEARCFTGIIDDIRIYNRILNSVEISQLAAL